MVKCPKCGETKWSRGLSSTVTDEYLKKMKENSPSYKYGKDHPGWASTARIGNYIVEFQCKNCNFVVPELCY